MFEPIRYDNDWKTVSFLKADLAVGSFVHMPELISRGWSCLTLAKASPEPPAPHAKVYLIDGTGNDRRAIQRAVGFVLSNWRAGRQAAVLCRSGANRSPAIAAGAMYAAGRATSVYGCIEHFRAHRREVGHYKGTAAEVEFAVAAMVDVRLREEWL